MTRIGSAIATMEALGVRTLVVTNAAGGLNPAYRVGDLVRITDVIHFMRESPLGEAGALGDSGMLGERPVLSRRLAEVATRAAARAKVALGEGVLFASTGPTYETPAEVRRARICGADLVSMSTTPELIAAEALGLESVAFSCVTNMATGMVPGRTVHHDEVIEVMSAARERCAALLASLLHDLEA
jgi:purine-nucleoside phosphorylase